MKKGKKIYEGKAKIIFASADKNLIIQHFKDDATAFNNQKKANIEGKGILNNRISEHILSALKDAGIENHLVKRLNMREQLVEMVDIVPIEFIVRNIVTGSLTKRLGIEDGTVLSKPLVEFCYKNDELGDPLVAREHIDAFGWSTLSEINLWFNPFKVPSFSISVRIYPLILEFSYFLKRSKGVNVLSSTHPLIIIFSFKTSIAT